MRLARPSSGATPLNVAATGDDPRVSPKPVVTSVIDTAVNRASTTRAAHATDVRGDRRQDQDADAGAAAGAVHETDPEGAERRADGMPVLLVLVRMSVQVEVAVPPADEEPDREEHDQRRHRGLGALLHALRQELLEEQDRQAEQHERERMTEAPEHAEPRRARLDALLARGDERRHGCDVVRVGRVTEPEQCRDEDHDEDGASAREVHDRVVEAEHVRWFAARGRPVRTRLRRRRESP